MPGLIVRPRSVSAARKIFRVFLEFVAQFGRCAEKFERFQRSGDDRRRDGVGKQIRPRALPQKIDDLLAPAGESAARAAERFAERAGDDVDSAHHAAIFVRAAAGFAEKSGGVRVVDHRERVVFFGEIANRLEVRDRSVHRETAISGDQSEARILRRAELRLQIGHVVVLVTKALRFAEADAVDDAGVIQFIADDRVFLAEQRFEQTAVGVETGWIKNRVFCAEEFRKRGFQFLVNVLRAANEAHARHAEPMGVERFFGRRDQRRMIGQPKIIVRAHVEHAFAARDRDVRVLRTGNDALGFKETLRFDFLESLGNLFVEFREHR